MGSFNADGDIDMSNGAIVDCIGKKRSGKSVMALVLMRSFPGDVIVIDPAGDDGPKGPNVIDWTGPVHELPSRFPEMQRKGRERLILHYAPDAGSPTFLEDMDVIAGVAMAHSTREKPAMLVVHEMGVLAPAGRTPPHTRRVLQHNRHRGLVAVFCMPRPKTVNPLVVSQADVLYVFEMPNPDDRKRVAEEIGWNPRDFDEDMNGLRQHGYLRFDANEQAPANPSDEDIRLRDYPALPLSVVQSVERWRDNADAPVRVGVESRSG